MESIIIIIIGLIFSVLSKSAKDKREIEKERKKRKEQINEGYQSFESYDESSAPKQTTTRPTTERNQKSLREMLMEELDKVGDEGGNLGDIFRRTLGEEPQKEIQTREVEAAGTNYEYVNKEDYRDSEYLGDTDYMENSYTSYEDYTREESKTKDDKSIKGSEIIAGESQVKSGIIEKKLKDKIQDNRQYNPFTRSLNRKDVIRGIIFSEVLEKPKSMRK